VPTAFLANRLRFENVPVGRYRVEATGEGAIMRVDDSAISKAVVVRWVIFTGLPLGCHSHASLMLTATAIARHRTNVSTSLLAEVLQITVACSFRRH
jgi:hypothetical protein